MQRQINSLLNQFSVRFGAALPFDDGQGGTEELFLLQFEPRHVFPVHERVGLYIQYDNLPQECFSREKLEIKRGVENIFPYFS